MGSGAMMSTAAVSTTTVQPLPLGKSSSLSISSSRSQLFGLNSVSRGQSLYCTGYRRVAAVRASSESEEGAREDAVSTSSGGLDRRQMLVGTTAAAAGLAAGASKLVLPASAGPVILPSVTLCITATKVSGDKVGKVECCPQTVGTKVRDFQFSRPGTLRVRKPAHLLTDAEKDTYEKAYAAISKLPNDDPRSFYAQANVHCTYCNYGFFQQDGVTPFQVHNNWLFFPFHRWYLYFHERILAKFANAPNFALAYWNYDNQAVTRPLPNTIPLMFTANPRRYPTLSKGIRNTAHYPDTLVDLNGTYTQTGDALRDANNALMYQSLVSGAKVPSLFFGQSVRAGQASPEAGGGTVENKPHGPVHGFTGGTENFREDMGNFYSAGRDTTFYSHHANVDRLWTVWKTLPGGRRREIDDPDWLDSSFLFYDENADLVRVKVRDTFDTKRFGYTYAPAPDLWRFAAPKAVSKVAAAPLNSTFNSLVPGGMEGASAIAAEEGTQGEGRRRPRRRREDLPDFVRGKREINKEDGFAFKLARPERPKRRGTRGPPGSSARSVEPLPPAKDDAEDDDEEEILVISGITLPAGQQTSFNVFINLPDADKNTPVTLPNFAGSYFNVAHSMPGSDAIMKTTLRIGVSECLELLGLTRDSDLVVTLVPQDGETPVVIEDVKLEYE